MARVNRIPDRICLWMAAMLLTAPTYAADPIGEQKIRAGLLYNFLKYTEWPATAKTTTPLMLCVIGDTPFNAQLQSLQGRSVNQRDISIRPLSVFDDPDECHLLFINALESAEWPKLRQRVKEKPILTVSDIPGFAKSGGMIEFSRDNQRLTIELNTDAIDAAQLHAQDPLRKLVTTVHGAR
jgi:hypothetical protein